LTGLNVQARDELQRAILLFADDLITEANRIDAGRNNTGSPQITSGIVTDAEILIRRGLLKPKGKWGLKVLRILAAVSALAVGVMYDPAKLQNGVYMLVFVTVIAVTVILTTFSI